jgi:hypothetical protein
MIKINLPALVKVEKDDDVGGVVGARHGSGSAHGVADRVSVLRDRPSVDGLRRRGRRWRAPRRRRGRRRRAPRRRRGRRRRAPRRRRGRRRRAPRRRRAQRRRGRHRSRMLSRRGTTRRTRRAFARGRWLGLLREGVGDALRVAGAPFTGVDAPTRGILRPFSRGLRPLGVHVGPQSDPVALLCPFSEPAFGLFVPLGCIFFPLGGRLGPL